MRSSVVPKRGRIDVQCTIQYVTNRLQLQRSVDSQNQKIEKKYDKNRLIVLVRVKIVFSRKPARYRFTSDVRLFFFLDKKPGLVSSVNNCLGIVRSEIRSKLHRLLCTDVHVFFSILKLHSYTAYEYDVFSAVTFA